jgi:allantoicase
MNYGRLSKMPSSANARRQTIKIAYSECAMHCGVAGKTLEVIEKDTFYNGSAIPEISRNGCYVIMPYDVDDGTTYNREIPMLKREAGWRS